MPPSLFERFQADHASGPKIPLHAGEAVILLWGYGFLDNTRAQQAMTVASGLPLDPDATAEAVELRAKFPGGSTTDDRARRLEQGTLLRAALQALEAGLVTPAEVRAVFGITTRT